jgi:hypothetical protein
VVIAAKVTPAIAETVRKQIEAGIDCIGDTRRVQTPSCSCNPQGNPFKSSTGRRTRR